MKYTLIIDPEREEIEVYAHERSDTVERIEELLGKNESELLGYLDDEIVRLKTCEIDCFFLEDGVYFSVRATQKRLNKKIEGSR